MARDWSAAAYKTTQFLTYVVVFAGILVASFLVKTGQGPGEEAVAAAAS